MSGYITSLKILVRRSTFRGKSPNALEVAKMPATLHTPLNDMNPPASWILFRSFNC